MHYLLKDMPAKADPLGPDNILVLALSVVTGAGISGQSRMTAAAKSPLTGTIGDSQGGGFFPAELKFAGFDALVIKGKSPKPVYIWIKDGAYELRDASHLWGSITGEVESAIREELADDKIKVLQIGPAGEKAVRFSGIISNTNRAAGRTGMGAVMGSKNLKAVAVRGKNRPSIADKDRLTKLAKWGSTNLADSDITGLAKYGTNETTGANQSSGTLPTYNYNSGVFDGWEKIDGSTMYDTVLRGAAEGNKVTLVGTPVTPAPSAAKESLRSRKVPTKLILITAVRNMRLPQHSATTVPLMTWLRFAKPMRSAINTVWIQFPAGQRSPGHTKPLMKAN
jgi:aldehyde:ferredoxin oxidoreductase